MVAVFAFATVLYGRTLGYDYTLDDNAVITSNRWVQQGLRGVWPLMTSHFFEGFFSAFGTYYRPLSMVTFAIEYEFFGFDPAVSHAVNVVLYGLSAAVVLKLAHDLLQDRWPALGAAALWVASPLHVEVAASIKSRDEILAFLLNALFLTMALKWYRQRVRSHAIWSAALFGLAMFTKESAITFTAVLPLTLFSLTKATPRDIGRTCALMVPGLLVYFAARFAVGMDAQPIETESGIVGNNLLLAADGPGEALATRMKFVLLYLRMLLWPDVLAWDYSIGQVTLVTWRHPMAWGGLAALLGLAGLLAWRLRRGDLVGWALGYCAITYAIPSNLVVKVMGSTLAERYLYPLTFGFCVLMAWGLWKLARGQVRNGLALMAALTLAWTVRSWVRMPAWSNNDALVLSNVPQADGSPRMVTAYASYLNNALADAVRRGDAPRVTELDHQATTFLERQIHLAESDPHQYAYVEQPARWGLVMNAWHQGQLGRAEPHLVRTLEIEPRNAQAWWYTGYLTYERGDWGGSVEAYEQAVNWRAKTGVVPGDNVLMQDYYLNLSLAHAQAGDPSASLDAADQAVFWQPGYAKAHAARGNALNALGRTDEAREALEEAFQLDPSLRP